MVHSPWATPAGPGWWACELCILIRPDAAESQMCLDLRAFGAGRWRGVCSTKQRRPRPRWLPTPPGPVHVGPERRGQAWQASRSRAHGGMCHHGLGGSPLCAMQISRCEIALGNGYGTTPPRSSEDGLGLGAKRDNPHFAGRVEFPPRP